MILSQRHYKSSSNCNIFYGIMSHILLPEICIKVLHNRFNDPNIKYVKHEITPISQDAEGYMGEHLNLNITYKLKDDTKIAEFFMKRKPTKNKVQEEAADNTGVYKHEIFLYDFLLKEFEKYGYDVSFAAKSFYCIPNEALILENLKSNGFSILERNTDFSMVQIQCLLKNIALYHAAGYAYERTKSKELNRDFKLGTEFHDTMQEIFYIQYIDQDAYCMKFWKGAMCTLSSLIDVLPNDEAYKQKFKKMFHSYEFGKIFVEETTLKKTCGHGDLWSNNMMFRNNNGTLECRLLDFQIVRYFYPTFDILLAIYCNTNKEFRDKHLKALYDYYYNTLSEILENYGYNVEDLMTKDEFHSSLNLVKADALIQVAFTQSLICMPKEKLNECVETEDGMNELMFGNDKLSVEAFQKDEKFRATLIESLSELYDGMNAKQKN